jgi:2,3-bisphosphoglycerate-dependent phosphoglycerate mutase
MTLILVRHGESQGNIQGIITGALDLDLTDLGREQARRVGQRLASEPVAALYASTRIRASNTAAAIGTHHNLDPILIEGLDEYRYGEAEGLTWPELAERFPTTRQDWGRGSVPGEEGRDVFRQRVGAAIDELAERHTQDLAVVACHGGTILHALAHTMQLPPNAAPRTRIGNCSITTITHTNNRPEILHVNDRCHLAD